jgi:hypothetical protein
MKRGLAWCGEGRSIVVVGNISFEKMLYSRTFDNSAKEVSSFALGLPYSRGKEGKLAPPRDQKADQKSNNFPTMSPLISMHPSNQSTQLTLQEGINANFRSTKINFGCMTLNGLTNTLLTTISKPSNSSSAGKPRLGHELGGYVLPFSLDVWKSFWKIEIEDKHILTWILWFCKTAFEESLRKRDEMASWEEDSTQKQVTIMISCLVAEQAGIMEDRIS